MAEQNNDQRAALAEWFEELARKALVVDERLATLAGMRTFLIEGARTMRIRDLTTGQWEAMKNFVAAPTGFVMDPSNLPRVAPMWEDPWL